MFYILVLEMSSIQIITAEDLRRLRKRFGLTQRELAERAGVSQSLIARIENKTVDPRLSTVGRLIEAITSVQKEKITARDVMHSPVITIEASDVVRRAVDLMKKYAISQLPVLSGDKVVGSIQESTLINRLSKSGTVNRLFSSPVYNIMDKPFATVDSTMDIDDVISLLSKGNPAVLVMEQKKMIGIITKIDVLPPTTHTNKEGRLT